MRWSEAWMAYGLARLLELITLNRRANESMNKSFRIWIDLANSPHVPFFAALIPEFRQRGHQIEVTARDYAQDGGAGKAGRACASGDWRSWRRTAGGQAGNLVGAGAAALGKWARGRGLDLAVSHNSYAQIAAASGLGIKSVTLMDYEHQPANHLAFRLASRV